MQYNASTDSVNLDGYDGRWTSNHQRHLCVFVTSRIDYCNSVLVGAPKALIDKLQRILNAAASDADKFDRGLTQLLHEKRHCLDVRDHVTFTLYDRAPQYLAVHWVPLSSQRNLRSSSRFNTSYGRRAFAIAGPSAWNSLPDPVRNPNSTEAAFRRLLKTVLFAQY